MMNITTKPLHIDFELKKKIEFICDFCNVTPTIISGNIRSIDLTNIVYVEPHRIIIKNVTLLAFVNDKIRMYKKGNIRMYNIVHENTSKSPFFFDTIYLRK